MAKWAKFCSGLRLTWIEASPRARSAGCEEIDKKVKAFLSRPIKGDWPYCGSIRFT